jgi:hypothetical protein
MDRFPTAQTRCRAGVAQADITPPVGIYHRMWGAALHDRATAVHRPLTATALCLDSLAPDRVPPERLLLLTMDHCLLDRVDLDHIRATASQAAGLQPEQVQVSLSHTHGAGLMLRSRSHLPGGELIGPYLDSLIATCGTLAEQASRQVRPATIVYGRGVCDLAAQRDYWDEPNKLYVCGFNPHSSADNTVLLAKVAAEEDCRTLATMVNYACHPTTLAWENTAISPDYVGALREVVEGHTKAPCLFFQGASGDLGPREGFVGDWKVADRNGRQLGFAVLSVLESLPPPGTCFVYTGPVVSGAVLGVWKHQPMDQAALQQSATWDCKRFVVDLPYRVDLPTLEESRRQQAHWQKEEDDAQATKNMDRVRDCRARVEQMTRQIGRLSVLPSGRTFPFSVTLYRLGAALWVLTPGELYSIFQTTLRQRFPSSPLIVATLTNDWQPGYLPLASSYGAGIYQESIAIVGPGSLEVLLEAVARTIQTILVKKS